MERDLQGEVAEASEAIQSDALAGVEAGFAHGGEGGPARTTEGRGDGGRQVAGHTDESGGQDYHVVAEDALQGVAEIGLLGAEALAAGSAPLADAARGAKEGDAGAIADGPPGDAPA